MMKAFQALVTLGFLSCALIGGEASAQTISQPVATTNLGNPGGGQSFTATLTGYVTAIAVASGQGGAYDLYLYNSSNGSGVAGSVGSPAMAPQTVTLPTLSSLVSPLTVFNLTTPFPVVAGNSYSFVISGGWAPQSIVGGSTAYSGGDMVYNYGNVFGNSDLRFAVYESSALPLPASPAPIPSSSDWSLVGAALLVLAAALFHRRRFGTRQHR